MVLQINWIGEVLDTFFSVSGKYGRWLNTRKNRWCFVIWTLCCCYWFFRDLQLGLYSQALFCLPSIALHIYGWYYWNRKTEKPFHEKHPAINAYNSYKFPAYGVRYKSPLLYNYSADRGFS